MNLEVGRSSARFPWQRQGTRFLYNVIQGAVLIYANWYIG